nr:hypothetical protein BaRGS_016436 [Batillaria attramentaria]
MRSPTSVYLMALSVTEILYVTVEVIPLIYDAITPLTRTSHFYFTYGLFVSNFVFASLGRFTYCLTALVCMERFFGLAFPMRAVTTRLVRFPKAIVLVSLLVLLASHVNIFLKYEVYLLEVRDNGEEIYSFRFTEFYTANADLMDTWSLINKVLFAYVMLFLSVLANILLVFALRRHHRSRLEMTTNDNQTRRKRQDRMRTLTILVSSGVFTILSLPSNIHSMAALLASYGFNSPVRHTFLFFQLLASVLFELAFCSDFCVYVIFSATYRATLRETFAHAFRCGTEWVKSRTHSEYET